MIELLAVIAIIGLLAGLVTALSGTAISKSRQSRVRGEHGRLLTAIESYKADVGSYPPDNTNSALPKIDGRPIVQWGQNSLFYELSGATYSDRNGGEFTTLHATETVRAADLETAFSTRGVQNSAREKKNVPYRGITFKPSQYAELDMTGDVEILITPVKGPYDSNFKVKNNKLGVNPWFYNLTGTNKHNPDGYDLWAEYVVGKRTNVIGNWKE